MCIFQKVLTIYCCLHLNYATKSFVNKKSKSGQKFEKSQISVID